jgi:hypothetical protein
VTKVGNLPDYCKLCGWSTAIAHAKSGDPAMIAGYLGKSDGIDEAIVKFAEAYADRTERDHELMAKAAKSKKIAVAAA